MTDPVGEPVEPVADPRLDPAEVAEVPDAVVDEGVPGQWPAIVDLERLIPTLWRKVNDLVALVAELAAEVHAVEATLGVNPHGAHATVAERLAALEAP